MKSYLENIYNNAVILNEKNILSLVDKKQDSFFVDLGCGDGDLTLKIANKLDTKNIFGVEIFDKNIKEATHKGIKVKKFNLNQKFDFENNYFDVVIANQVIEHIYNSDNFISEIYRILNQKVTQLLVPKMPVAGAILLPVLWVGKFFP